MVRDFKPKPVSIIVDNIAQREYQVMPSVVESYDSSPFRQAYYSLVTQNAKPFHRKLGYFSYFTAMTKTSLLEELAELELKKSKQTNKRSSLSKLSVSPKQSIQLPSINKNSSMPLLAKVPTTMMKSYESAKKGKAAMRYAKDNTERDRSREIIDTFENKLESEKKMQEL